MLMSPSGAPVLFWCPPTEFVWHISPNPPPLFLSWFPAVASPLTPLTPDLQPHSHPWFVLCGPWSPYFQSLLSPSLFVLGPRSSFFQPLSSSLPSSWSAFFYSLFLSSSLLFSTSGSSCLNNWWKVRPGSLITLVGSCPSSCTLFRCGLLSQMLAETSFIPRHEKTSPTGKRHLHESGMLSSIMVCGGTLSCHPSTFGTSIHRHSCDYFDVWLYLENIVEQ